MSSKEEFLYDLCCILNSPIVKANKIDLVITGGIISGEIVFPAPEDYLKKSSVPKYLTLTNVTVQIGGIRNHFQNFNVFLDQIIGFSFRYK